MKCEKVEKTSKGKKAKMEIEVPEANTKGMEKKGTPREKSAKPKTKMEITTGALIGNA